MRLLHRRGEGLRDTQTGMLHGIPRSARCVQRFDDSLNSAIHITYRISLRSSSMREPRDPLLKVVYVYSNRHSGLVVVCVKAEAAGDIPPQPNSAQVCEFSKACSRGAQPKKEARGPNL
jgi:hypothetical protein